MASPVGTDREASGAARALRVTWATARRKAVDASLATARPCRASRMSSARTLSTASSAAPARPDTQATASPVSTSTRWVGHRGDVRAISLGYAIRHPVPLGGIT